MTHRICPICEKDITQAHDCFDYDYPNFSIELELLDLPFDLEPYGCKTEQTVTHFVPERTPGGFSARRKPVPLFLRL